MSRLDHEPEIIQLAQKRGIEGKPRVESIRRHCCRCVGGWVADAGAISGIDSFEAVVTSRLHTVLEEIHSDDDWFRLKDTYALGKREFVFAEIKSKFDDASCPHYGALVQRRHAGTDDSGRYVAVILCSRWRRSE